jgi:hypothetical protein
VFAVSDLAKAGIAVKPFVLDHRVVRKGRLAVFDGGLHHVASDAGFTGCELGVIGRTAEIGFVARRLMRRLDHGAGMIADDNGNRICQ